MYNERKKGIACSVALHVLLFLLLFFGLPSFMQNDPPPEPVAITVELLPISKLSNVKPSEGVMTEKPKEQPKAVEEIKKPAPPPKSAEPTPPPPPPTPKPTPVPEPKKPEPKPVPKKPEPVKEKPKKPKEDDLDTILKNLRNEAKEKEAPKEPAKEKPVPAQKAISSRFDPSQAMSISERDAIMGQLARCWNPPAGAKNARELVVVINAEFQTDGTYIRAEIANESRGRYNSDTFYRAAADAALRAVRQCSPLKNLDPSKYDVWRVMELHFDPREMLQ